MKRDILILSALCTCCNLFAEEITVKYLRYAGPYEIKGPFIVDSLDVNSKKFTDAELLKTAIPFNNVRKSNRTLDAATTAGQSKNSSVSLASFYLNSDRYTDGTLQISGPEHYEVYIDNEKQTPANGELKLTLEPRRYEVVIKYLTAPDETNHIPKVTFKTDSKAVVTATTDPEKRYTLSDVFDGTRIRSVSLSPNGKYLLTAYQTTYPGGDTESFQQVTDRATRQVLMESNNHHYSWMPRSNRLYYTRKGMQGKELQPKQRKSLPTTFPTVGSALPRQRISCCSTSPRKDRRKGKTFRKSLCLTTASRDGVPVHSSISTTWQPECSNVLPTGTLRLPSTIFPTTAAICSSLVANGS
jgi:hypothetical protein